MAFLGDCFVWGFGVDYSEIFASLIERKSNRQLELGNLDVPGYGTDQERLLRKTKEYQRKPDEVALMDYYFNDVSDIMPGRRDGYDRPYFSLDSSCELRLHEMPNQSAALGSQQEEVRVDQSRRNRVLRRFSELSSAFHLLLYLSLENDTLRAVLEEDQWIPAREISGNGPFFNRSERKIEEAQTLLFRQLADLNGEASRNGGKLTIVLIPAIEQVYSELWEKILDTVPGDLIDHFEIDCPNRTIASWCEQNDISFIDLLPELNDAGTSNPFLFYLGNQHLPKYGHGVVANAPGKKIDIF